MTTFSDLPGPFRHPGIKAVPFQTVLITGGRDYMDSETINSVLDIVRSATFTVHSPLKLLVHGQAAGADSLAGEWAKATGVDRVECPANWKGRGKAAGFDRNRFMLAFFPISFVLAFPGGRGTANQVEQARSYPLPVIHSSEVEFRHLF
jgi:hypothetical protein